MQAQVQFMTLFHTYCETLHRSGWGGENEGEWEEDSSGGLIGHCVSPPTVERDRRACKVNRGLMQAADDIRRARV